MQYKVKLDIFQGPFDMLLSLTTKHRIDVYDIPITSVIQDYIDFLNKSNQVDLSVTSEFLLIAATLLKIKARSLVLPESEEEGEELSTTEARELLIARLLEYKKYKNAAETMAKLYEAQYGFCGNGGALEMAAPARVDLLEGITAEYLGSLLTSLLSKADSEDVFVSTQHVLSPPVDLRGKIDFVLSRLKTKGHETFSNLTKQCKSRIEVAVTFLALLELCRKRLVALEQTQTFGEITIRLKAQVNELDENDPSFQSAFQEEHSRQE